jgi:hypothetical protein
VTGIDHKRHRVRLFDGSWRYLPPMSWKLFSTLHANLGHVVSTRKLFPVEGSESLPRDSSGAS